MNGSRGATRAVDDGTPSRHVRIGICFFRWNYISLATLKLRNQEIIEHASELDCPAHGCTDRRDVRRKRDGLFGDQGDRLTALRVRNLGRRSASCTRAVIRGAAKFEVPVAPFAQEPLGLVRRLWLSAELFQLPTEHALN